MFLLVVGFGFKVAIVPFHQWAPDVYEGAPTTIAAFISAGPKAAGFAAFLRIFMEALPSLQVEWSSVLIVLAMLTMTLGNVIAIAQTSIKRMLAYSSIAHAGYVLIGLVAANNDGISSAMLYLLVYCVMNIGAFGAVILAKTEDGESLLISDYAGLGLRKPLLAMFMTIMLVITRRVSTDCRVRREILCFQIRSASRTYLARDCRCHQYSNIRVLLSPGCCDDVYA